MPSGTARLLHHLDLGWLADEAERDPIRHAFALWDATRMPERTRFVVFESASGARSYLLLWYGTPSTPVVHWVGDAEDDLLLLEEIPRTTEVAVVPERVADRVVEARRATQVHPVEVFRWEAGHRLEDPPAPRVRRLGPDAGPALAGFARHHPGRLTHAYANLDLSAERVWGAFDGHELVGVARASVTLPSVWIVSGVFVSPSHRGRGLGRDLATAATLGATKAGAIPALYVRSDNEVAKGVYRSIGYSAIGRRVWLELPVGERP